MANVRDSDTSLWLHNKLGTSNDSWTTGSICTQLNAEVLKNIKDCFPDLQTQVKLKLLLSFFHIPRRNVEEWKSELEEIIEVAAVDSDLWVAMLSEVLKTFPSTGTLNTEIAEFDETRPIFSDMIGELRRVLAKHTDIGLLPLECLYLNKNALVSVVGQQANQVKHFTLKRKPKSVALRSELLAKAAEVQANQKKAQTPTVPVRSRGMPRKMTDTTPLKGLPSGGASWRGRTVTAPRPPVSTRPGIKLLDIADQPATIAMIKRKRKLEMEESVKSKPPPAPSPPPPDAPASAPAPTATPAQDEQTPQPAAPSSPPPTPAVSETTPAPPTAVLVQSGQKSVVVGAGGLVLANKGVVVPPTLLNSVLLQPGGKALLVQNINSVGGGVVNSQGQHAVLQQIQPPVPQLVTSVQPSAPGGVAATPTVPAASGAAPLLSRRGLSLTREQMLEAQDMFRNANRVTRPEKALILGFMAGSRENPCPNLGNIVTIKLSENIENVLQSDDTYLTMLSEMHFQMNYNNGQWTRLKKYRHIDGMVPQKIPPGSTVVPAHSSVSNAPQHTLS